jgi:hypothetical protein
MTSHCGTGTLVKSGNEHFILTAAHCAERLAEYDEIGLPIRFRGDPFLVQRMSPIYVGERKSNEWGPDLAFMPIHPVDVANINANSNKIFYDLDRYVPGILREEHKIDNSLWAVVGTPVVLSRLQDPKRLEFTLMAFKVGVESPITKESFDYIDIRVALDGKNALPTFEGVSGGGLWQAEVGRNEDGSLTLVGPRMLVGCAFYQTDPRGLYRYIRCHGPRSIYKHGVPKLIGRQE